MNFSKFSIFRLPNTYKRFDYTPRYFDPAKEERDKKLKKLQADRELQVEEETEKRISFRQNSSSSSLRRENIRKSNLRLFVILGGLLLMIYYLYINYGSQAAEIIK